MNSPTFNQRMQKARIGASAPHDESHYRFQRVHPSNRPFIEPVGASVIADAVVGAVCLVIILGCVLLIGGAF